MVMFVYRVTRSMTEFLPRLAEIWSQLYRVMDDVHEGTRVAAANTTAVLSKVNIIKMLSKKYNIDICVLFVCLILIFFF